MFRVLTLVFALLCATAYADSCSTPTQAASAAPIAGSPVKSAGYQGPRALKLRAFQPVRNVGRLGVRVGAKALRVVGRVAVLPVRVFAEVKPVRRAAKAAWNFRQFNKERRQCRRARLFGGG